MIELTLVPAVEWIFLLFTNKILNKNLNDWKWEYLIIFQIMF